MRKHTRNNLMFGGILAVLVGCYIAYLAMNRFQKPVGDELPKGMVSRPLKDRLEQKGSSQTTETRFKEDGGTANKFQGKSPGVNTVEKKTESSAGKEAPERMTTNKKDAANFDKDDKPDEVKKVIAAPSPVKSKQPSVDAKAETTTEIITTSKVPPVDDVKPNQVKGAAPMKQNQPNADKLTTTSMTPLANNAAAKEATPESKPATITKPLEPKTSSVKDVEPSPVKKDDEVVIPPELEPSVQDKKDENAVTVEKSPPATEDNKVPLDTNPEPKSPSVNDGEPKATVIEKPPLANEDDKVQSVPLTPKEPKSASVVDGDLKVVNAEEPSPDKKVDELPKPPPMPSPVRDQSVAKEATTNVIQTPSVQNTTARQNTPGLSKIIQMTAPQPKPSSMDQTSSDTIQENKVSTNNEPQSKPKEEDSVTDLGTQDADLTGVEAPQKQQTDLAPSQETVMETPQKQQTDLAPSQPTVVETPQKQQTDQAPSPATEPKAPAKMPSSSIVLQLQKQLEEEQEQREQQQIALQQHQEEEQMLQQKYSQLQKLSARGPSNVNWEMFFQFIPNGLQSCHDIFPDIKQYNPLPDAFRNAYRTYEAQIKSASIEDHHIGEHMEQFAVYYQVAKAPFVKTVCETGFGAGHSAFLWLQANPDVRVYSFDMGEHEYSRTVYSYLNNRFQDRLKVVWGDSIKTLPQFRVNNPEIVCDIVVMDGGHTFRETFSDYFQLRQMVTVDNIVLLDNYPDVSEDYMKTLGTVWEGGKRRGELIEIFQCDYRPRPHGFSVGRFVPHTREDIEPMDQ